MGGLGVGGGSGWVWVEVWAVRGCSIPVLTDLEGKATVLMISSELWPSKDLNPKRVSCHGSPQVVGVWWLRGFRV